MTEQWPGANQPWQIQPFDKCVLKIGNDLVLTGYVDSYLPTYDATSHRVRITGRSATEDLIDCMPNVVGGQFNGYGLAAIADAIAGLFGIAVKVQTDLGEPFAVATISKTETAFAYLDDLARQRGVLMTDDPTGALVLTAAGSGSAAGSLVEGVNILSASLRLTAADQFSVYQVRSQSGAA